MGALTTLAALFRLNRIAGGILKVVRAILRWCFADWRHAGIVVIAGAALLAAWGWQEQRALNAQMEGDLVLARNSAAEWQEAHQQLVADMHAKTAVATKADRANARRVASELAMVRERTAHAYEASLADTDRAARRLRQQLDTATALDRGDGTDPAGGSALAARCKAFGAPDCDALLATLTGQLAAAERNTAALIGLQEWACGMLAVDWGNAVREPLPAEVAAACQTHGIALISDPRP